MRGSALVQILACIAHVRRKLEVSVMKRSGLIGIVCDRFFGCGAGRLIGALLAALAASCVAASSAGAKEVIKTITVGSVPRAVSSDGTHVWVTDWGENTVSEIEASSGKVINTIKVGEKPYGVSSDGTHVWVTNLADGTVSEIEASSGKVINTIEVGESPFSVSSDGSHVWVTNEPNTVSEIEASSAKVINTIPVGEFPGGVSSDGTHVWVTSPGEDSVREIEASSGKVINTIPVGVFPISVSSDGTHVWVTDPGEDSVREIEASSGKVINTIKVGKDPEGVSSDGTHVWVTNEGESTVSEIEAVAQAICTGSSGTIALSPGLTDAAVFQRVETKGTLTGCSGKAFTEAKYTATLTTDSKVSCSALSGPGVPAFGTVQYAWSPKTKGTTGTLSLPLTETADITFSSELETGPNSPSTLSGTISENYTNAGICACPTRKTEGHKAGYKRHLHGISGQLRIGAATKQPGDWVARATARATHPSTCAFPGKRASEPRPRSLAAWTARKRAGSSPGPLSLSGVSRGPRGISQSRPPAGGDRSIERALKRASARSPARRVCRGA